VAVGGGMLGSGGRASLPRAASLLDVAFSAQQSKRTEERGATTRDTADEPRTDAQRRFAVCRNTLIYVSIVDKLHALLKVNDAANVTATGGAMITAQSPDAPWNVVMQSRLRPNNALRNACRTLLKAYESELLVIEEAQEFFDDLSLLGELNADFGSADAYLERVFELASLVNALPSS